MYSKGVEECRDSISGGQPSLMLQLGGLSYVWIWQTLPIESESISSITRVTSFAADEALKGLPHDWDMSRPLLCGGRQRRMTPKLSKSQYDVHEIMKGWLTCTPSVALLTTDISCLLHQFQYISKLLAFASESHPVLSRAESSSVKDDRVLPPHTVRKWCYRLSICQLA